MENCEYTDQISKLPDCVLSYIVSLLSIKDAVKTSIISHRWRHLYTLRSQLTFNYRTFDLDFGRDEIRFVDGVDHIMRLFHGKNIISLEVDYDLDASFSSHIDEWINAAAECGVKKIGLRLSYMGECSRYNFPYWLFSEPRTSMLQHLHLQNCALKAPIEFHGFSCLKILELQDIILEENFINNLSCNCPQLEDLLFWRCNVASNYLRIVFPSLRVMHLIIGPPIDEPMIEISATNLITFYYSGDIAWISSLIAPQLKRIYIRSCMFETSVLPCFENCSQLEILNLCIRNELEVQKLPRNIAVFRNLMQLALIITIYSKKFQLLPVLSLVKASPFLQKLFIELFGSKPDGDHSSNVNIQPQCLITSHDQLEEFVMKGSVGNCYAFEFAMAVLGIATNLKQWLWT